MGSRCDGRQPQEELQHELQRAAEALMSLGLYSDSVSRAYYAAFHVVRVLLLSRGVEAKTHSGAIHLLNIELIRTGLLSSSFNRLLSGLQRSRALADYDAAVIFSADDARAELEAAKSLRDTALELLSAQGWLAADAPK